MEADRSDILALLPEPLPLDARDRERLRVGERSTAVAAGGCVVGLPTEESTRAAMVGLRGSTHSVSFPLLRDDRRLVCVDDLLRVWGVTGEAVGEFRKEDTSDPLDDDGGC